MTHLPCCARTLLTLSFPNASLSPRTALRRAPAVRGNRPGKQVQLEEYEIRFLCTKAREIFINQPILLELEAPIKICGKPDLPLRRSLLIASDITSCR